MLILTPKPFLLIVCFVTGSLWVHSQQPLQTPGPGDIFQLSIKKYSARTAIPLRLNNKPSAHSHKDLRQSNSNFTILNTSNLPPNCIDSSFRKTFEADNRAYSFLCTTRTHDGSFLMGGYGRNKLEGPPYKFYAVLSKFDSLGNHIWSKELRSDVYYSLYIESMKELSDGSIIVTGWHDNAKYTATQDSSDFFVSKLTATGNELWFKTYHSLLNNQCTTNNIRFASIAEGDNGDLLLAGTIVNCPSPWYLVAMKLNSSGQLQWKNYYGTHTSFGSAAGIYYNNNQVTVIQKAQDPTQVRFINLDYTTGSVVSVKAWQPEINSFYSDMQAFVSSTRLNNGHYCVYGLAMGDYNYQPADVPHFIVLEFDENYQYLNGFAIMSALLTNTSESKIVIDEYGHLLYTLTVLNPDASNKIKYLGSASIDGIIFNQRQRSYSNLEFFYDQLTPFADGSYAYINNLAPPGQDYFFLDYSKLHNSDTGSVCLGTRNNFAHFQPVQYIPLDLSTLDALPDPFKETPNQNNSTLPIDYYALPACIQKSFCDTLKIHGNNFMCGIQEDMQLTAFRNLECGERVNWSMDTSVLSTFSQVNDTTLVIHFKKEWQGWLHAQIIGRCGLLEDSLLITVVSSPGPVNLGTDTSICPSNTLVLNAHKGYSSYRWNDGSIDSLLTVTGPGKYYVDVNDACGNSFSDTVLVAAAPPAHLDLGNDRTKCNDDTLHLHASAGFINYSWGPAYNIISQSGSEAIVRPLIDTIYFVKAEKTPGCFGYDTIHITTHFSPPVSLGKDTSFCTGDSLVLHAGNGFTGYQWSTGETTEAITVKHAMKLFLLAVTAEGCFSSDTISVLNVFAPPQPSLAKNNELCAGSVRILNPGNFTGYQWQDGSTDKTFAVSQPGIYWVKVTDGNGCTNADTTTITTILPVPRNFLGADTTMCSYGELVLSPSRSFGSYQWNSGGNTKSIIIDKPGQYWLLVTDEKDCKGSDTINVFLKQCMAGLFVPSAFTPNHDGKNDVFRAMLFGDVLKFDFKIYNRWGEVVFHTNDRYKGWNGVYNGIEQDSNVFTWMCQYQLNGDTLKLAKGTVMLIR